MITENEFMILLNEWKNYDGMSNLTENQKAECVSFLWERIKQLEEKE